jgi:SAM-dependent methyltransferase
MTNKRVKAGRFVRSVIDLNVRVSRTMEKRAQLPTDKTLWALFERQADALIRALPDGAVVLDLGGGRRFIYGGSIQPEGRLRVIAVDISSDELALNSDVGETCVADVSTELPFPPASVDLILSRALLEHVHGVPSAINHMGSVLKPGGMALHLVPCRYSFGPLLRLTHLMMPQTRGYVEFPVVYDSCWPQALERSFKNAGFREVQSEITWACPGYFEAVFPLFVLHAIWEWAARKLRIRRFAAYTVVLAVR